MEIDELVFQKVRKINLENYSWRLLRITEGGNISKKRNSVKRTSQKYEKRTEYWKEMNKSYVD